ncbi:MAG: LXG domain-containing protein [Ruminococcus sp.]|nr:LXG domain-containing protein [Ruminococcus sp.]
MKAYPLIYSRTKNDDFVPDFLARPADINYETALKYVGNSIANLDALNGIRYNIFRVDDYCVYGVSCRTKILLSKIEETSALSPEAVENAKNYLKDCKGRNIVAFIGFAIPVTEAVSGSLPDIELSDYWKVYQEYLEHQWEDMHTHSEQLTTPEITTGKKSYTSTYKPDTENIQEKYIVKKFRESTASEQAVLDYFTDRILNHKEDISFISDLVYKADWDSMNFSHAYVSDTLYNSILNSAKSFASSASSSVFPESSQKTVRSERSPSVAEQANSRTRPGIYGRPSQFNIPAPPQKPTESEKKSESGGLKKNTGIHSLFRNIPDSSAYSTIGRTKAGDSTGNSQYATGESIRSSKYATGESTRSSQFESGSVNRNSPYGNVPKVSPYETGNTEKNSAYYEQLICDNIRKYEQYIIRDRNQCIISPEKDMGFYKFILKNVGYMHSANQVNYQYISKVSFSPEKQQITILFK